MEETKRKNDGSGLLKILVFIIFILAIIYIILGFDLLKLGTDTCENYINPLNILYVDGTEEWSSDCKRIKVENFEVDVREYSFDDGVTWQESNVYNVCGEMEVKVKIRDANQKILGEGVFNVSNIDSNPPKLTIPGDITVTKGDEIDLKEGVSASDDESGLSGGILISPSTVDTNKEGETIISYSVSDKAGNKITKTRKVIVKGVVNVTSFYLTPYYVNLKRGATYTLKAIYYPSDLPSNLITWSSSNTNIVTVNKNGVITAVGDGTAYITATLGNKKATMTVVVGTISATSLKITPNPITLTPGGTQKLTFAVTPSNVTYVSVSCKSSNAQVATIGTDYVVRAVGTGSAVITCTTNNGISSSVSVSVSPKTVTMYRYRDSSVKEVKCKCRQESTGKCKEHYTCKWNYTKTVTGGSGGGSSTICAYSSPGPGYKKGSGCGTCCRKYETKEVCSTCKETVWSEWSEWSTTPVTASDTREVETKVVEQ